MENNTSRKIREVVSIMFYGGLIVSILICYGKLMLINQGHDILEGFSNGMGIDARTVLRWSEIIILFVRVFALYLFHVFTDGFADIIDDLKIIRNSVLSKKIRIVLDL